MAGSDYVAESRALWTETNAELTGPSAALTWAKEQFAWGIFGVPEREVRVLRGLGIVELGCGTAYFSTWLAKQGARPVDVDLTSAEEIWAAHKIG